MQLSDEVQWEDEREVDVHFRPEHGSSEGRHGLLKNYVRVLDMKRKTVHNNNLMKPIVCRHDEAPDLPRIPKSFGTGRIDFDDMSARMGRSNRSPMRKPRASNPYQRVCQGREDEMMEDSQLAENAEAQHEGQTAQVDASVPAQEEQQNGDYDHYMADDESDRRRRRMQERDLNPSLNHPPALAHHGLRPHSP